MGLLKEALLAANKENDQQEGLLTKIERAAVDSNSFQSWAFLNQLKHAALFQCIENKYIITHAQGIDSETIISSISSYDFFNGTLLSNSNWISAKKETKAIEPFYQLLSQNYKESLKEIYFLKLSNCEKPPVLMIFFCESEKIIIPEPNRETKKKILSFTDKNTEISIPVTESRLKKLLINSANLLILSLKLAVKECITINVSENLKSIIENTIFTELYYFLFSSLYKNHICRKGTGSEIKIAMFSNTELDLTLLQAFISNLLVQFIGENAASRIVILNAGKSQSIESIQKFLTNE